MTSEVTNTRGIQLTPVDTLFFRDGTPSAADSSTQLDVGGVFPPHPPTVVGAVRAALARANGWSGRYRWPAALSEVLGDGYDPESLGTVSFDGPYLLRDGVPHFRAPVHLLGASGADGWRACAALQPGEPVNCDLGDQVRLPQLPQAVAGQAERLKPAGPRWMPAAALATVLGGELPVGSVLEADELWQEERRVGIERDSITRTVKEGMLYSTRHVRLNPGVSLGVRVTGVPRNWNMPWDETIPLGGEGRAVQVQPWKAEWPLAVTLGEIENAGGPLMVIALAPLDVGEELYRHRGRLPRLGDATVVSACLPRPQQVGGWRTLPPAGPLPLCSVLPAGSVLFCEMQDAARLRETVEAFDGLPRIGTRQSWGFGAVALGVWRENVPLTRPLPEVGSEPQQGR